jgi:hypothetical protein
MRRHFLLQWSDLRAPLWHTQRRSEVRASVVADEHGPAGESRGSRDDQIVETIARSFCTTLRPAHGRLRGEVLDGMEELAKCHAAIALVVPGVPVQSVPVRRKKTTIARTESAYHAVLADMVRLIREARRASARAVNTVMTATYWEIGRRIVEHEQGGEARAGYGERFSLWCPRISRSASAAASP